MKHYLVCFFITIFILAGCNGGSSTTNIIIPHPNSQPVSIIGVGITGPISIPINKTVSYIATATKSDDSPPQNITNKVLWEPSNKLVKTDTPGAFVPIATGPATISIEYNKGDGTPPLHSSINIIITDESSTPTLTNVEITESSGQNDQMARLNKPLTYHVIATQNNGTQVDITNSANTKWDPSTNLTPTDSPGVFIPNKPGDAYISVSYTNSKGSLLESTHVINVIDDASYKVKLDITGPATYNDAEVNINDSLTYTATATRNDGRKVDLTNSDQLKWEPTPQLSMSESGIFKAITAGQATLTIKYKNALGEILESYRTINVKGVPLPPTSINYDSLRIGGDINTESAESGETLKYRAIGTTIDNHESDLTESSTWTIREKNAPLKQVKAGVFEVESGHGTFTIKVAYKNNNGTTIESTHIIQVVDAKLKLTSIRTYPNSLTITTLTGGTATYQLKAKGFDNKNNEYRLDPELVKWTISPTTGATIDESSGYLQINSRGPFTITAHYNTLESNTQAVIENINNPTTTTIANINIAIKNDQIFYVSTESIVKSCPVTSMATINNNATTIDNPNYIASESECTTYHLPEVDNIRHRRLYYNERYKVIYTFGDSLDNTTLYTINPNTNQIESYSMPMAINDISYDLSESNMYLLSIESKQNAYTNTIYKCPLTIDGPETSACTTIATTNEPLTPQLKLGDSYLLYNDIANAKHLYTFTSIYNSTLKLNHLKINHIILNGVTTSVESAFNSAQSTNLYYLYDIEMTKPSILNALNNTYIYSIGLRPITQTNDDLEPNTLQIKSNGNVVINYESTLNVFGSISNYSNSANIRTYSNLAIDSKNKWVFYGSRTAQDHLTKCSYSKVGTKGDIQGACKNVTKFKDTYRGITFVPGATLYQPTAHGLANLFFMSKTYAGTYVIAQCSTQSNGMLINENDCIKYSIPNINAYTTLTKNKDNHSIYVTTNNILNPNTNAFYNINPNTYQVKQYKPLNVNMIINKLSFGINNKLVYIINEDKTGVFLNTCELSQSGDITSICSKITLSGPIPMDVKKDIINYNDQYLYVEVNKIIYKCTLASNGDVNQCSLLKIINPTDRIDYNTSKIFNTFSSSYYAGVAKAFFYVYTTIGSAPYPIWPLSIDPNNGELSLSSINATNTNDPHIINGGSSPKINRLDFDDTARYAYVSSANASKLITCPADSDIEVYGTINAHGNLNACTSLSSFTLNQVSFLLYLTSN